MNFSGKFFLLLILVSLSACQSPHSETPVIENKHPDTVSSSVSVPSAEYIFSASCSEPFMYCECYTNKLVLVFPESRDSVIDNFASDIFTSQQDFSYRGTTVAGKKLSMNLIHKSYIHPGSGEIWPKTIIFEIDSLKYQGCANNKTKQ